MCEVVRKLVMTSTGLLERVKIALGLQDLVGKTEAYCSVKVSCVMISASMFVRDEIDEMQCSPLEEQAMGESAAMYACWRQ